MTDSKLGAVESLLGEGRLIIVSDQRWMLLNALAELVIRGERNPEVWLKTEEIAQAVRDREV